jgi:UDP-N-acetylmuramoylalanine--D-glutamate ligase
VALEISSFQLETTSGFCPKVGVLLNLSPDHLDRHAGMEEYVAAKKILFENQTAGQFAVLNRDDPAVAAVAHEVKSRVLWFSIREEVDEGVFLRGKTIVSRFDGTENELMKVGRIPLFGPHNVANVLAAAAATLPFGLPAECYGPGVESFPAAEHRLEKVRELEGVLFVNDSKATNIGSLEKALESFEAPVILIAGGRGKRGGYESLRPLVEARVKAMVTIGEDALELERALGDLTTTYRAETMPEAVKIAAQAARPGDCVLLAPGCASFDMFDSYGHRGRVFKEAVEAL